MRLLFSSDTTIMPLEGSTTTPAGLLKLALAPAPSAKDALPLPASVVTRPWGVMRRIRWLPVSETTMSPLEGTTATRLGLLKRAAVPEPSAKAADPPPASVTTRPRGEISKMRLLPESATTMVSLKGTTATSDGAEKAKVPARVETTPRGVMSRMREFPWSATTTLPLEGSTAMPVGLMKRADVPGPSA